MAAVCCHKTRYGKIIACAPILPPAQSALSCQRGAAPLDTLLRVPLRVTRQGQAPTPKIIMLAHHDFWLPRRTSSDGASRRPRSHHRQQSIPMVCPAAAVSGWTATASYRRASWGCRTPKPLRWGLAPRPPLVGGA
nr:unnamed protein product [uncultured bacterium]